MIQKILAILRALAWIIGGIALILLIYGIIRALI